MFFCWAFKNTGICSVLCISGPKSTGIYSIFCVCAWLPPTTLKRKNVVIYSILWLPKSEKSSEKCVKTAFFSDFRTSKTHLEISPSFCPPQTPKNVKTPPGWRILGEGRRHTARPRVAKAMLSHHHRTASPDLRAAAPAADPGTSNRGWLIFSACPTISNGPYFVFQTTSPAYLVSFLI